MIKGGRRRPKGPSRYVVPEDSQIDYKNYALLQKFLTDRGKLVPRRISGVSARGQRKLVTAVKRARFLALLTSGGVKK